MGKVNLNSIREETRKKVSKQYAEEIQRLQESLKSLRITNNKVYEKFKLLERENEELKEKIQQYEDWIERLQNFVNMDPDERERAIQKYREEERIRKMTDSLLSVFSRYTSNLFEL